MVHPPTQNIVWGTGFQNRSVRVGGLPHLAKTRAQYGDPTPQPGSKRCMGAARPPINTDMGHPLSNGSARVGGLPHLAQTALDMGHPTPEASLKGCMWGTGFRNRSARVCGLPHLARTALDMGHPTPVAKDLRNHYPRRRSASHCHIRVKNRGTTARARGELCSNVWDHGQGRTCTARHSGGYCCVGSDVLCCGSEREAAFTARSAECKT
jgi:hypothetical protein